MKYYEIVMCNEIVVSSVREDRIADMLRGYRIVKRDEINRTIYIER